MFLSRRLSLTEEMSRFDRQLVEITTKVVKRWGVDCPQDPKNPKRAVVIALKQAIAVAKSKGFVPVYPNDHGWSSTGFRPLTVERLKHDERPTGLDKAGEEWGVFVIAEGFGNSVLIPFAADLSQEAAASVASIVDKNKDDFLDLEELPLLLSRFSDGTSILDGEVVLTVGAALWDEVRDMSQSSNLPLSEAVFFRRPVMWDMLRARLSGGGCPPLPAFSEKEFLAKRDRSVKFDRRAAKSTGSLLESAAKRDVDLETASGRNWFALVVDGLNSLGLGKPMEGLSVLLHFEKRTRDEGGSGIRSLCIGYGLDPLQASYLVDLAQESPSSFHTLDMAEDALFGFVGASVISDMHLAAMNATIEGRDDTAYQRLVEATAPKRDYLNA